MKRALLCLTILPLCVPTRSARAESNESGTVLIARNDILPKVNFACETQIAITYDHATLSRYSPEIAHDQTGGDLECNEPLRYLWYACKSPAGRAAIKAARITKVVCKGTASATGSLTVQGGVITVERANEEAVPHIRARAQFEAALHLKLPMPVPSPREHEGAVQAGPYYDSAWHDLRFQANPVTSTTTYCTVDGKKVEFDRHVSSSYEHRKQDAQIRCLRDGRVLIDLTIKAGKRTGLAMEERDQRQTLTHYRDGERDGEETITDGGRRVETTQWDLGEEVSRTELDKDGKLTRYRRHYAGPPGGMSIGHSRPDRYASPSDSLHVQNGRIYELSCSPRAKDDRVLRTWCGFEGEVTQSIYDGTEKVTAVLTFKNGVLQREGPGTSDYAPRHQVAYVDGKKHGEERVLDAKGNLRETARWEHGVLDGPNLFYAEDGKKVIKEIVWKAGVQRQLIERYLNGNPKLRESYEPGRKQVQTLWDTGKPKSEGTFVTCEHRYGGGWCEDGVHKSYYESGTPAGEENYKAGKQQGAAKRWWPDGTRSAVEEYVDGRCTRRKTWTREGKADVDEEYESDGSRKLHR